MKKLLILSLLTLASCNQQIDFPTSLFGIKLLDSPSNYLQREEIVKVLEENKDKTFFATTYGKYNQNSNFDFNFIYLTKPKDGILKIIIVGGIAEYYESLSNFKNSCRENRNKILSGLNDLRNINDRSFKKKYYITKDKKGKSEYIEDFRINKTIDNIDYSLVLQCKYNYPESNIHQTSHQTLAYSLYAMDKANLVTDKKILERFKEIESGSDKDRVFNKPLTDEIIKNDFRGI